MPYLDLDAWPRRAIYDFFLTFEDPWFNLCAEVDAAPTWRWCRATGAPFSLAAWYAVLKSSNQVPAFRMRLRPEGVWLHERVRVGATALRPNQSFTYVYFPDADDFPTFRARAEAELATRLAAPGLEPDHTDDDLLHCTVVPWIRFTGIKHARAGGRGDSVPKIGLGKATPVGESVMLPVSVEGHHSLIDGVHVGAFFEALTAAFGSPEHTFG